MRVFLVRSLPAPFHALQAINCIMVSFFFAAFILLLLIAAMTDNNDMISHALIRQTSRSSTKNTRARSQTRKSTGPRRASSSRGPRSGTRFVCVLECEPLKLIFISTASENLSLFIPLNIRTHTDPREHRPHVPVLVRWRRAQHVLQRSGPPRRGWIRCSGMTYCKLHNCDKTVRINFQLVG